MGKRIDDELDKIIAQTVKSSGMSQNQIETLTSYMITYLNTGSKYGQSPEAFFKWYKEQGGKL